MTATTRTPLADALAMQLDGDVAHATVHDDFDVFGIPLGGYVMALFGRAVLSAASEPDLFTITVHYLRRVTPGPLDIRLVRVGGSRRFTSWQATALQHDEPVATAMASVGDRTRMDGPTWSDTDAWMPGETMLSPVAGHPDLPFTAPRVAEQFGLRLDTNAVGFAFGARADTAELRGVMDTHETDQLTALVACDITPPAAWNALGSQGWVPTIELTAHVRARPRPGPLTIETATHHVQDGFLDEDAVVRDVTGTLIVQSRQLARWTST